MTKDSCICLVKYYSPNNERTIRNTTIGSLILSAERISNESMNNALDRIKDISGKVYSDKVEKIMFFQCYKLNNQEKFKDTSLSVEFNREYQPTMIQIGSCEALVLGEIAELIGL